MKPSLLMLVACLLTGPALAAGDAVWSVPVQLTNGAKFSHHGCSVVGPDGTLHLLVVDNRTDLLAVYYQRRAPGHTTWSPPFLISQDVEGLQAGENPALCLDDAGQLYAAWEEYYAGGIDIRYRRSQDQGRTWSDSRRVVGTDDHSGQAVHPGLQVDSSGTAHLVWQDAVGSKIMYRQFDASGGTLTNPVDLYTDHEPSKPGLTRYQNKLAAYWQTSTGKILYQISTIEGLTQNGFKVLDPTDPEDSIIRTDPAMAYDEAGDLHAVWSREDGPVIYRCYNPTTTWSIPVELSGTDSSQTPCLAAYQDRIAVAWVAPAGISTCFSADHGKTFSPVEYFTDGFHQVRPGLVADRQNFRLIFDMGLTDSGQVWERLRDDTSPPAPGVFSRSHPWPGESGNNRPEFTWVAPDNPGGIGVQGYAYTLDSASATDPGTTLTAQANLTSVQYDTLSNGNYYFHIRAIDRLGNVGAVTHYALSVANETFMPADQTWVAPSPVRDGRLGLRFFLSRPADVRIEFYDTAGRRISTQRIEGRIGINPVALDIGDWVNGTYFYRLTGRAQDNGQEASATKPFVVLQ